jgi:hypothetical protein
MAYIDKKGKLYYLLITWIFKPCDKTYVELCVDAGFGGDGCCTFLPLLLLLLLPLLLLLLLPPVPNTNFRM